MRHTIFQELRLKGINVCRAPFTYTDIQRCAMILIPIGRKWFTILQIDMFTDRCILNKFPPMNWTCIVMLASSMVEFRCGELKPASNDVTYFFQLFSNWTLSGLSHLLQANTQWTVLSDLCKMFNWEANLWKMWSVITDSWHTFSKGSG